ncbi:MAG: asparagine synthetase B, partial [Bacteroidales bacterium]|nr:asparagine synthetase B [Bacteroidales bacterium]
MKILSSTHVFFTKAILIIFISASSFTSWASSILIPMDDAQKNHLKSYGLAYWALEREVEIKWLLNYRGGGFLMDYYPDIEKECKIREVSYQVLADVQAATILRQIESPESNTTAIQLIKAPKIVVYSPKNKLPWDDAVTLVLTYAEIPYDLIYDEEVLSGVLPTYDWLHLHHEDFTGQYGKFWANYRNAQWYKDDVNENEAVARKFGFSKVSQLKLAVAKKIRDFVAGGGYLFAMCSAPDSFDISLAAEGVDICEKMYDGDPMDPNAQEKLDFSKTFAFTNFNIVTNPMEYRKSDIDIDPRLHLSNKNNDFFTLFEFSAKWDPIPTMLTQSHERVIRG